MQWMKDCILEQPDAIRAVIKGKDEQLRIVADAIGKGPFQKILLIGSGTSLNAAHAAVYLLQQYLDAEVQVLTPFEFQYYYPHRRIGEDTLVLGISQTARSIGTIHCMEICRQRGAKTVFVTAEPDNPGAQSADVVLNTLTGLEMVGAKTKGFTTTMAMLFAYAADLAGESIDLTKIPELMEKTLAATKRMVDTITDDFKDAKAVTVIGGGPLKAAALEGGLKMLEGVRIPVEVYDVEEYMHGPYHCLEEDSYLVFMVNRGPGLDRSMKMIRFAQEHSRHVFVIGYAGLEKEMEISCTFLPIEDGVEEILTPLLYVIPMQWIANDTTQKKGRHPEQSRYPQFHAILGSKYMPKFNYYEGRDQEDVPDGKN